jgi:hypothetical protein
MDDITRLLIYQIVTMNELIYQIIIKDVLIYKLITKDYQYNRYMNRYINNLTKSKIN